MIQTFDVCIVGGGAIGVTSAYYLNKAGKSVCVIDKGAIGKGCSEANAGLVVPSHVVPLAAPGVISQGLKWMFNPRSPFYIRPRLSLDLLRWIWSFRNHCNEAAMRHGMPVLNGLLQASHGLFRQWRDAGEIPIDFVEQGLILTYDKEKGLKDCLRTAQMARDSGLEVAHWEGPTLRQQEPAVHDTAKGGVYFKQDAHLDPFQFIQNTVSHLKKQGVVFMEHSPVKALERSGDRIVGVRLAHETVISEDVVVCGGAWSPGLVPGLRLPIQAGKGYSLTLPAKGRIPKIPLILSEAKVSVTPFGDRIRFGGTLELSGLDASINRNRAASLLRVAADYLDDLDPNAIDDTQIWAGYRPCTPDGLPVIGKAPGYKNLSLACGHAMIGISLAPITGQLVSEVLLKQTPSLDLAPLSAARFA